MSDLWLRLAAVTFGPKSGTGVKIISGWYKEKNVRKHIGQQYYFTKGVYLSNPRISFDIIKNTEQNKAKIRIYNLAEKSRKFLNENDKLGDIQVTLEVGYMDTGLKVLFIGDVERSTYKRVGPDWITELYCKDGGQAIQDVHLDKSYAGDVKVDVQTVVKDLVDQIKDKAKVNVDNVMSQIRQKVTSEKIDWGLQIQGLAMKTLRSLLGKQGKEVSIQDNNLEIAEPTDKESTKESAVTISATTGMVGSPVTKEKGIEFKALINPLLKPMGQVSSVFISSTGFNSIYRVRSLKFKGDTHDNPWYMQGIAV